MEITRKSREFTPAEIYKVTKSNSIKRMSDIADNEIITAKDYIVYEDTKDDGSVTILSIITDTGIYATNSATFTRTFLDIVDIMGELPVNITVGHDTSKNGRKFIFADLA